MKMFDNNNRTLYANKQTEGRTKKKMKSRRERKKEGGREKGREESKAEKWKGRGKEEGKERERRYLSIVSLTIYSQLVNHQSPDLHKSKPCINTCNKLKKNII